jgi:hypothetical protein
MGWGYVVGYYVALLLSAPFFQHRQGLTTSTPHASTGALGEGLPSLHGGPRRGARPGRRFWLGRIRGGISPRDFHHFCMYCTLPEVISRGGYTYPFPGGWCLPGTRSDAMVSWVSRVVVFVPAAPLSRVAREVGNGPSVMGRW